MIVAKIFGRRVAGLELVLHEVARRWLHRERDRAVALAGHAVTRRADLLVDRLARRLRRRGRHEHAHHGQPAHPPIVAEAGTLLACGLARPCSSSCWSRLCCRSSRCSRCSRSSRTRSAASDLDGELGRRLEAIAAIAATQIRDAKYLSQLSPGDEHEPLYEQAVARLNALAQRPTRGCSCRCTSTRRAATPREAVAIGTPNRRAELDRAELARVFEGKQAASVTFQGNDGRWYKTGYAPVARPPTRPSCSRSAPRRPRPTSTGSPICARGCSRGAPGSRSSACSPPSLATLADHAQRAPPRARRRADRRRRPRVPIRATSRDELGAARRDDGAHARAARRARRAACR